MAENITKDSLSSLISVIKQMKSHFKAFDEAEKAIIALANLQAGISKASNELVRKKMEAENANKAAIEAKATATLEADKWESHRKTLRDEHARDVAAEKQKAARQMSDIQNEVLKYKNDIEESIRILNGQSKELESEVKDKRAILAGLNKEIDAIKARLGG